MALHVILKNKKKYTGSIIFRGLPSPTIFKAAHKMGLKTTRPFEMGPGELGEHPAY